MTKENTNIEQCAVNTIKMLAVDSVEKANSGHPGLPMGCADIAYVLWSRFLKFNPEDTAWANRDRFILSAGHGSALLYSLLHLFGFDLSIDDLKHFRQSGSKTPGHPEYGHTPGVETTTGPLGQGIVNGVGMALAERLLAEKVNSDGKEIINHYTYCIVSDGDMMEGLSGEGASFAGNLGLSKLICIYLNNNITIEGSTDLAFSEDVGARFAAYDWQILKTDGHDHEGIKAAIEAAQEDKTKPSLIIANTHIGKGSPNKQDSAGVHGSPLGDKEIVLTKEALDWPTDKTFFVPDEVKELFSGRVNVLKGEYTQWMKEFEGLKKSDSKFSDVWDNLVKKEIPQDIEEEMLKTVTKEKYATRSASGAMMQVISDRIPAFLGGSADLAPSTKTYLNNSTSISKEDMTGKNIHFGIREHAMGAIMNGLSLYGGCIPYGSTFLIFSDYVRPSIRLSALMKAQAIYIFTHDSIFVGEDGPTHEPVEQIASLRLIPNLLVIRPSDATETAAAWKEALENKTGPTALILTRQDMQVIDRSVYASQSNLKQGGYVLHDCQGAPEMILLASGSEVELALSTAKELEKKSVSVRVVSMPSTELFDAQSEEYKNKVLPSDCKKLVAIEAGVTDGWYKYIGRCGLFIGIDRFGASAPAKVLAKEYGFTVENVLKKIEDKWSIDLV